MADLDARLRELATDVRWAPTPDLAARMPALVEAAPSRAPARRRRPARRNGLLAALLALVVVGAVAAAPGVGSRVLERLGLKERITKVERLPPSAAGVALALGERRTLADAENLAGYELLRPAALGAPHEVYYRRGVVTFLYRRDGLILFTQVTGSAQPYLRKLVLQDGRAVRVNGAPGYFLRGPHTLIFARPGEREPRVDETRLAQSTLLWERGGVLLRVEADAPLDELLRIARSAR